MEHLWGLSQQCPRRGGGRIFSLCHIQLAESDHHADLCCPENQDQAARPIKKWAMDSLGPPVGPKGCPLPDFPTKRINFLSRPIGGRRVEQFFLSIFGT